MPTPIYHITARDNLPAILAQGGLHCQKSLAKNRTKYADITHRSIQDRRAGTFVPRGPKGRLHDYVPFYFAPRSPMLYAIHKGNVAGCPCAQRDVVYLCSYAEDVCASGIGFVFTDGHGTMALTRFYDDLDHLDNVDWPLMQAKYWSDTKTDGDRKRRRQAEFLVHSFFPLSLVHRIAVSRKSHISPLTTLCHASQLVVPISEEPSWYYWD